MASSVELRNQLEPKQDTIQKVYELAGESYDFDNKEIFELLGVKSTMEVTEKLRSLNAECEDLYLKAKEAYDIEVIEERQKAIGTELKRPGHLALHHPDPNGDARLPARAEIKSFGQLFVEAPEYKAYRDAKGSVKQFTVVIEDADVKTLFQRPTGWGPDARPSGLFVEAATRPIQVLDLIPMANTDQSSVVYWEETIRTHAAAERAEGATAAESTFRVEQKVVQVRFIGDSVPVTDEQLDDVGQARAYLDNRLSFGVRQKADSQILVGDGVAENIRGITNVVGIQTQAKSTDPTFDAVHKAMTKIRVTGRAFPNGIVLHPNDWEAIRLTRTADGIYILGNPAVVGPMTLFGVPVTLSDALTENTGLVGDFANHSLFYERRGVQIEVGYSGTQFPEFKQTIRAAWRVAFIVSRPAAFCTVTGI